MVYTDSVHQPSLVELARAGNFQAIAHWLNAVLLPHGIRAYVGGIRPGCLRVLIELPLPPTQRELAESGRTELIHFICHRIWKLNSAHIEGIRIAGKLKHEQAGGVGAKCTSGFASASCPQTTIAAPSYPASSNRTAAIAA
jgi:poly-gamma-glutamate synthesis protein (capsule biosynthesis protein)